MIPLSVAIITKNEEKNIEYALESVKDAAEIIVLDSFSTDKTPEICRKYTDKIFQKEWQGYAKQKQSAVDLATNKWVLILDADERLTPELKAEIMHAIEQDKFDGFYLPRKNFFMGKWIKHSGWWPDYILRVFKKDLGRIEEREVHEKISLNGSASYLKNPLEHYTYNSISEFIKKMDNYSCLSAKEMKKKEASVGIFDLMVKPFATFIKMFFIRLGLMDGLHGLILAVFYSYYTFLKYAKTWEMSKK